MGKIHDVWNQAMEDEGCSEDDVNKANSILDWFQENYPVYKKCSDFVINRTINAQKTQLDPIFDLVFQGGNFANIIRNHSYYISDATMIMPALRGHLASVKESKNRAVEKSDNSLERVLRIIKRFHLAVLQLNNRREGKVAFTVMDEYDVQDLLSALLNVEFQSVIREDYAPSYAGGASRIDFVLKNEQILIEAKKASRKLKAKEIGDQIIIDIARYAKYPEVKTLVCLIYDPDFTISNPELFEEHLKELPTKNMKVIAVICPKAAVTV